MLSSCSRLVRLHVSVPPLHAVFSWRVCLLRLCLHASVDCVQRHLEHETAIFLSELLVPLLLSSSIPTDQREVILSSLVTFFVAAPASFTLGLFLDFDCSVEEKDVVLPLLETLCAQATRPVSGPNGKKLPFTSALANAAKKSDALGGWPWPPPRTPTDIKLQEGGR